MNFYAFSALFNTIVCTFLSIILFIKRDKPRSAVYFNFYNLTVLLWAVSYFFWQTTKDYNQAYFWVQMLMVGAIFTAPAILLFSCAVAGKEKKYAWLIILSFIINGIFAVLHFTHAHYFILELRDKINIPLFPTAGRYYWIFLIQWFGWFIFAFYQLYWASKHTTGDEQKATKAIFYITVIALVFAAMFNYFLWYDIPIPPIASMVVSLYAAVIVPMLLKGKFYKTNILYFEFFASVITLLSLIQFILRNELNTLYLNLAIMAILLLTSYFLLKMGRQEQKHLQQIDKLNLSLRNTLKTITNHIDDAVLIVSLERQNMIEANMAAINLFGYQIGEDLPLTYLDFVRGKINQTLISALEYYKETGKNQIDTEISIPQKQKLNLNFYPFTLEKDNDAVIIIIKK